MKRYLEKQNYRVIAAGSSMEALNQFEAHAIDLVITDVVLLKGEPHGVSLARTIRHAKPQIPVILVTGHASLLQEETALPGSVIEKPVDLRTLLSAVKDRLGRSPPGTIPGHFPTRPSP